MPIFALTMAITYKDAGVDVDEWNKTEDAISGYVKSTFTKNVLGEFGSFGGLFELDKKYKNPILVSSTDGVGTKLKIAVLANKHDTVGQDLVNHCTNDILVQGAEPLFFLDYIGTGKLKKENIVELIKGFAKSCKENGCALVGGETAELPKLYHPGDYDLAGFIVGVVEKDKLIDGSKIKIGDKLLALKSSGLHTNGYSLAIKVLLDHAGYKLTDKIPELINDTDGPKYSTLGDALLAVHKSYLHEIKKLFAAGIEIKGLSHITGGGFVDNIPRILPNNTSALIDTKSWKVPALFRLIQKHAEIDDNEMFKTFNMGVGMIIVVDSKDVEAVKKKLDAFLIGEIVDGKQDVVFE